MSAHCTACGQEWPRDPRLEVACPTCGARIGSRCKRPSGHEAPEPHVAREELCILGGFMTRECPASPRRQGRLFEAPAWEAGA